MTQIHADKAVQKKIDQRRRKIDQLDTRLIQLLIQRFEIVREIGMLKRESGMPIFQKSRWTSLIRDRIQLTQGDEGRRAISRLFIRDLFTLIHSESLDLQEKLRKPMSIRDQKQ